MISLVLVAGVESLLVGLVLWIEVVLMWKLIVFEV
jgi:hypothetical protein